MSQKQTCKQISAKYCTADFWKIIATGSSYSGLNEEYVQTMRQEYGHNISQEKKRYHI